MSAAPPIVVTGAAGFIGARLACRLIASGACVLAVDRASHFGERAEIGLLYREAGAPDILDRDALPARLAEMAPGAIRGILHIGACTDTTEYDEAYLDRANTAYTRTLWQEAARLGVPFLYASSAAVYGDGERGYDDEAAPDRFAPLNPYGWSKQRFDAWALAEGVKSPPPRWAGFRFFNVYGFGETHKNKMASVLRQAFAQIRETGRVRLFRSHREGCADGEQMRDFVLVDDVVDVLLHAWREELPDGIYNLGTGRARTFLDLARAAFAAAGRPPAIDFFDMPEAIRSRYQYFTEARMEKLRRAGYDRPFTPIEEGAARYWNRLKDTLARSA